MSTSISKIAKMMAIERHNFLLDHTIHPTGSMAKAAGFLFPVFIHSSLWDKYIAAMPGETALEESSRLELILKAAAQTLAGLPRDTTDAITDIAFELTSGPTPGSGAAFITCGPFYISTDGATTDLSPTFTIVSVDFPRE